MDPDNSNLQNAEPPDAANNEVSSNRGLIRAAFVNICAMYKQSFALAEEILEDDDDDEDEELVAVFMMSQQTETPNRTPNYVENIVQKYSEKEFQSHFRLQWATYEVMETLLGPELISGTPSEVPVRKKLLAVLWLLATPDSFRSVGERFDLSKSDLSNFFAAIVKLLNKHASKIIKWPRSEQKETIKQKFATFSGMRGCIGAIDGTFIEIKAPKEHAHVFICRKCFYCIQLQAVATPDLQFLDVFTGYPGSVGDRRVFVNSPLYKNVIERQADYFQQSEYILGDKAYPVLPWCVPPYINRRDMNEMRTNFNTKHAKTRQVVERAFALLFGRFRRLKYLDMNRQKLIPATILASCILHNLCIINDHDLHFIEEAIQEGQDFLRVQARRGISGTSEEENPYSSSGFGNDGHNFRDQLALSLM
ncbi:hypothetical protein O0L34_g14912 [Tuta absoluta]|nr:hypothetical protein O0L34_g14912 [Tuta absoluta]